MSDYKVKVIVSSKENQDSDKVAKRHASASYLSGFFISTSRNEKNDNREQNPLYSK